MLSAFAQATPAACAVLRPALAIKQLKNFQAFELGTGAIGGRPVKKILTNSHSFGPPFLFL
jgi:5,10-methylene-tetrahydrofolate dehydrogenase/methenyl tetrahydrofolate cyclohydrolase